MLTDIEIAQSNRMKPIRDIAADLGIPFDDIELYGSYKAKLPLSLVKRLEQKPDGKLILVTAINPTPAGEGKTTTTIGLGQAMNRLGKSYYSPSRTFPGTCHGNKGRRGGRRILPGCPDGRYKPSLYRRHTRCHCSK